MRYTERLHAPLLWWVIGVLLALTFVIAVGAFLGPWGGAGTAVVSLAVVAAIMIGQSATITVDDTALHAGGARLEWAWAGAAEVLDAAAVRHRMGPGVDPRAWWLYRGYVPEAVEIAVADEADPHPYWLVSTRHAERLLAAIEEARS